MQIAPHQRRGIDALRKILIDLEDRAGADSRERFALLRRKLEGWAARVAVIGQIKAGKSSFLNALLGMPDFLPSDVNPWTSVVTNLRINVAGDPVSGARFDFLDESAWEQMISGNSAVRRLAEELLPGFDTELLQAQASAMRDRAQRRLGRHYNALLGSQHEYDFCSPALLQRYVCAGPDSEADFSPDQEPTGRYATLTRDANIFLRRTDFAAPVILTDTPGVNDPFLVRDEYTCQSLDRSEVFIVTLSAHQALAEADIALMRMLSAESARNVIIFVNRLDEVEEFGLRTQRILEDVARRLAEAIPQAGFTLLAGSAWWAELAMRTDDRALLQAEDADTPQLAAYLQRHYGYVPADRRERLMLASGMEAVKDALSEVIDQRLGPRDLGILREEIAAEIGALISLGKREKESLRKQIEALSEQQAPAFVTEIRAELQALGEVRDKVDGLTAAMDDQIDRLLDKSANALRSALDASVLAFLEDQKARIREVAFRRDVFGGTVSNDSFRVDMLGLRGLLEQDVQQTYQKFRRAVDVVLNNCLVAVTRQADERFEGVSEGISLDQLPHDSFMSALTMVQDSLTLDTVSKRSWAFWRRGEVDVERTHEVLRRIALTELAPVLQRICRAFGEALAERILHGKDRVELVPRLLHQAIAEREMRLRTDRVTLEGLDPERRLQMQHRLQSRIEVLDRRLQLLSLSSAEVLRQPTTIAA